MKTKTEITLRYENGLVVTPGSEQNDALAASFSMDMMKLGFMPNKELFETLKTLAQGQLVDLRKTVLSSLKKLVGADVQYVPFYPNFPQQVMEASDLELFLNAIVHYWTFGQWRPNFRTLPRDSHLENTKFKEIGMITEDQFKQIFVKILSANESISASDKKTVEWFIDNVSGLPVPEQIPFKENLCLVAGLFLANGLDISELVTNTTDVLRIATFISGGDISLAGNTKFASFPRETRRILVRALEKVARAEDINRHRGKWVRLFHGLHVGELGSKRLYSMAKTIRDNKHIETFNSKVEKAIATHDLGSAAELLTSRPGEFARRLDHLLRLPSKKKTVLIENFLSIADKVPTRVLLQLLGHFKTRAMPLDERIVMPKGGTQRAFIVRGEVPPLSLNVITKLNKGITAQLRERFSQMEPLGNVWIDPELKSCPIPTQQRSASESLVTVARGTRLPIGDKGTLRFFIYWVGRDIDLSASFHNEQFEMIRHISYTNLRNGSLQTYHSGDITHAPKGAAEFIDVTIDPTVKAGIRYVVMNVFVYSGPTFKEHASCYAGWMTREKPKSNEIFDPKTVEQKLDLTSEAKNAIPVVFDLVERKAIWTDLTTATQYHNWGNNIESNHPTVEQNLQAIVNLNSKVTLYELFKLHADARGTIVDDPEGADVKFTLDDRSGITPYDITTINSEYVV